MRDISSVGRKRKQHKPSTAGVFSASTVSEDFVPRDPLEGTLTSFSAANFESEGVVTSSKRIKPNQSETKSCQRDGNLDPTTHSRLAVVIELKHSLRHSTARQTHRTGDVDDEAFEHTALFEERNKPASADSNRILARYKKGPLNNFPDYGPLDVPNAVELAPARSRTTMGERKSAGLPGGFVPQNTLQRGGTGNQSLPRPNQKKTFDLHGSPSFSMPEDSRATKRQKIGPDSLVRTTSPDSIIDLSREESRSGTVRPMSSKGSSSKKTVQSGSQSQKQSQPTISVLGTNDAYKNVEKMIGFENGRTLPALKSALEKRRRSEAANEASQSQQYEQHKAGRRPFDFTGSHPHVAVSSEESILIYDGTEDIEKVSRGPPRYKDTFNLPASRPQLPRKSKWQGYLSGRKLVTSRTTLPFETIEKPNDGDAHASQARMDDDSTKSSFPVELGGGEKLLIGGEGSANDVDVNQDLNEDSVDQLDPELLGKKDQINTREFGSRTKSSRFLGNPKSESIVTEGNIPQSTFSKIPPKTAGVPKQPATRLELKFGIVFLWGGTKEVIVKSDCNEWQYRFDYEERKFDLFNDGQLVSDAYESLVLKPDKILSIKFHDESSKLVILRSKEAKAGLTARIMLQTESSSEANRFVSSIRDLGNYTFKPKPTECEQLDKIFDNTTEATLKHSNQLRRFKPEDIALMVVKEARIATAEEKQRQDERNSSKTTAEKEPRISNISRPRGNVAEYVTEARQSRRRSSAAVGGGSIIDSAIEKPIAHETRISSSKKKSAHNPEIFYQSRVRTRSSFTGQYSGNSFDLPKSRSPSPLRWTKEHPGWMNDRGWKTSLVFPIEGKKKATVDAPDVERLDEGQFLNDNLIAFYLRYLEDNLEKSHPKLASRIYFQNTFFYETLTKGKIHSNNINYNAVKRWTSKVDLFSFDYVIVPVCEKMHWYVAIICNHPKLLREQDAEKFSERGFAESLTAPPESPTRDYEDDGPAASKTDNSFQAAAPVEVLRDPKTSRSISPTFQSQVEQMSLEDQGQWPESEALASRNSGMRSHLLEADPAWTDSSAIKVDPDFVLPKGRKTRKSLTGGRKHDPGDPRIITLDSLGGTHSPTCSNLREYLVCEAWERLGSEISPGRLGMTAKGLPHQTNHCDCGIFVLGYVERFLSDPDLFVHDILQGNMSDKADWADLKAPIMRENIRDLIFELHDKQVNQDKEDRESRLKAKKTSTTDLKPKLLTNAAVGKLGTRNGSSQAAAATKQQMNFAPEMDDKPFSTQAPQLDGDEESVSLPTPGDKVKSSPATTDGECDLSQDDNRKSIESSQGSSPGGFAADPDVGPGSAYEIEILDTRASSQQNGMPVALAISDSDSINTSPPSSPRPNRPAPNQLGQPLSYGTAIAGSLTSNSEDELEEATKRPRASNIFKKYAKDLVSPANQIGYRSTLQRGTSSFSPLEIDKSSESNYKEVRETPPPDRHRQDSFEDILAQGESLKSPSHLGQIQKSPVSVDSSPITRSGLRKSDRKIASQKLVRYESDPSRVLRTKSTKHT